MEESLLATPGPILRNARTLKGFTQADVASRLRLALHLVQALEVDDYTHFTAPVYIRGYLRAYATLLDLDSAPLLSAFEQIVPQSLVDRSGEQHYVCTSMTKMNYLHRSKRRFAYGMSWVIGVFLVVLLGVWWYGQHHRQHLDVGAVVLSNKPAEPVVSALTPPPAPAFAPTVTPTVVVAPAVTAPVVTPAPATTLTAPASVAPVSKFHETFVLEPKKSS